MAGTAEGARKARAKLSDEAKALGLTVAEYRARRRAAKLTSAETRTIVQVTPEPVAARVTPPPAGTPQPEAPGHAPEAPRARPSPEPEPEQPTPLAQFLRWYGGAPSRADASEARPECGEPYVLGGKVVYAWPVRQPKGWTWWLTLDGVRVVPNSDAFPFRPGVTLAESEYAAAHPSRTDSWGKDERGREVRMSRNGHVERPAFPRYTGEQPWNPHGSCDQGMPEDPDAGMWRRS